MGVVVVVEVMVVVALVVVVAFVVVVVEFDYKAGSCSDGGRTDLSFHNL